VNPKKTIPYSCVITCFVVLVVYFGTYISVLGFLPW
jgi:amino acid transporter